MGKRRAIIGPFDSLHVVYHSALRLYRDADDFELELAPHQRFIVFDGVFYGDFELLTEPHSQTMTLETAPTRSNTTTRAPLKPLLEVLVDLVTEQRGAETARRLPRHTRRCTAVSAAQSLMDLPSEHRPCRFRSWSVRNA